MAGAGYRRFTKEVLPSDTVQRYLMDQVVMVFPSESARDAALTTPADGMVCYIEDNDRFWYREANLYWRPLLSQWPEQTVGNALPQTGLRRGDHLYSHVYECNMVYGFSDWRQLSPVVVDNLTDYVARLTARGVSSVHQGFLVAHSGTNRLYMAIGGLSFVQVGGADAATNTSVFTNVTGWNYQGTVSHVKSLGGGLCYIYVNVVKATSALTVPSDGNVGNTLVGNVQTLYRPATQIALHSGPAGRVSTGFFSTNGDVTLAATTPNKDAAAGSGGTIAVGEEISLSGLYRLNDLTQ